MTEDDLISAYPLFFDLDHMRQGVSKRTTKKALLARALDPENTAPPAPNILFDPAHVTRLLRPGSGPSNPILRFLAGEGAVTPHRFFHTGFYARNAGLLALAPGAIVCHALAAMERGLVPFHPFLDEAYIRERTDVGVGRDFYEALFSGALDNVQPHPLFDLDFIRDQSDGAVETLSQAVDWYWAHSDDAATHPLFDPAYYRGQFPDDLPLKHSVFHYLISPQPKSPHPLFETAFYLSQTREKLGASPARPLEHFVAVGQGLRLDPSPYVDTAFLRDQLGCEDVLQAYVTGGHTQTAPHPLVRLAQDQLWAQSLGETRPVAERLAVAPETVPMAVTPELDMVNLRNASGRGDVSDAALRDRYFRVDYPAQKRPNGLVSLPCILTQCDAAGLPTDGALQTYFRQGWHLRKRLLLALDSFADTASNQAWLTALQAQINHPELEVMVISRTGGPLSGAFSKAAHTWVLTPPGGPSPSPEMLRRHGARLAGIMQGNPPDVVLVEGEQSGDLLAALAEMPGRKVVFGGTGLGPVLEAAKTAEVDHVWTSCAGPDGGDLPVSSGYLPTVSAAPVDVSDAKRSTTRAALGLSPEAVVVLGTGSPNVEAGADLFGAIAAEVLRQKDDDTELVFLLHGSGSPQIFSPVFYARYFAENANGGDTFRCVAEPSLPDLLTVADIYLSPCRDGGVNAGAEAARMAGVPVVLMQEGGRQEAPAGVEVFPPYELAAAVSVLKDLIQSPARRASLGAAVSAEVEAGSAPGAFTAALDRVLEQVGLSARLRAEGQKATDDTALLLADDRLLETLAEASDVPARAGPGLGVTLRAAPLSEAQDCPPVLRHEITTRGLTDLVVCTDSAGLHPAFIQRFPTAFWIAQGKGAEMEEIYRLGLDFSAIYLRRPELAQRMAKMNPRIAALMTPLEGAGP